MLLQNNVDAAVVTSALLCNKQQNHTQRCFESATKMSSQWSPAVAFHFIQSHKLNNVSECEQCACA